MKIRVDDARCQGHTLCHMYAPELFDLNDDDGHAVVLVDVVPPGQEEPARRAMAACPEQAIEIDE